jgi:hypothetical protein
MAKKIFLKVKLRHLLGTVLMPVIPDALSGRQPDDGSLSPA